MGLNFWIEGSMPLGMDASFPENFTENVLGKILIGIGWSKDRCAFENCGRNTFGEVGNF